jgi:hypothetical protein
MWVVNFRAYVFMSEKDVRFLYFGKLSGKIVTCCRYNRGLRTCFSFKHLDFQGLYLYK